jgi:hypothetical protein
LQGTDAVLSGLFFGGATPAATFVSTDMTTAGNWQGVYGTGGYNVIGASASYPGYAQVTPIGTTTTVWASSTTDPRALQQPGGTGRVAAALTSPTSMTVDLNLFDSRSHRVSLYLLDWANAGISEQIDILDPTTGAVLDSRIASAFSGGEYLTWNLRGHVQVRITRLAGPSAVLSGLFFG